MNSHPKEDKNWDVIIVNEYPIIMYHKERTTKYVVKNTYGYTHLDLLKQRPKSASSEILIKQLISAGGISNCQDQITRRSFEGTWKSAFPGEELCGLISEQWKEMGWQGKDPSTDFRGGGGFISLENLLFFARNFPKSFRDLLRKQEGDRAMWEYPFAVAGVSITFMLIRMLDLEAGGFFITFLLQCLTKE
ncbi:ELMO domain-containing protein A-like [Forsythia ovata]|uniref:ELMO domain-containing protein A-like n=1 Tax=Forsythia ovata TaxID=205694 RepID=A0ABD1VHB4_9LAMI